MPSTHIHSSQYFDIFKSVYELEMNQMFSQNANLIFLLKKSVSICYLYLPQRVILDFYSIGGSLMFYPKREYSLSFSFYP